MVRNSWGYNTIRSNINAPSARGNASNTTNAAGATTQQQSSTSKKRDTSISRSSGSSSSSSSGSSSKKTTSSGSSSSSSSGSSSKKTTSSGSSSSGISNSWGYNTIQNNIKAPSASEGSSGSSSKPASSSSSSSSSSSGSSSSATNWRNSSAGVAISLGTATINQKAEAYSQGASAENIGLQRTNVGKGLYSKAGLYDVGINIESSQTTTQTRPTNYISIQQQRDFYDASGGLKLSGGADARQTIEAQIDKAIKSDPIIGNTYSTAQTLLTDPVGRPNLTNNIFEQFEVYNKYDGSGDQRKTAAALTALEIPSYVIGGGVAGVGTRAAQTALTKISGTKIGGAVVKAATSPVSKNVPVSPATFAANTATGYYAADIGYRVLSQPTAEGKISTAANIALKEIPAGAFGAVSGYKATAKFVDGLKTIGKTEIPAEKVTAPGIPLGNFNEAQLTKSFEKNILSPQPFKFARANDDIGKSTASTISAKLDKLSDTTELYHATANSQYFGKNFTVKESASEFGGLFTAPKGISYFLGNADLNVRPSFIIREFNPVSSPALINIKSRGVKAVDWQKAADSVGRSVRQVKNNPKFRKTAVDNFLISSESKSPGYAYMPMIKKEYEAVIPQGTQFKRLPTRYYTRVNGKRIPIYEYERVGFTPTTNKPQKARSRSSSSSSSSQNYVTTGSPISSASGRSSSTRSSSQDFNSRLNTSLNRFSNYNGSPASGRSSSTRSSSQDFNSRLNTSLNRFNTTNSSSNTNNKSYSALYTQKTTPQKINPIKSNYLSRQSNQLLKRKEKKADERKETEKIYSAVRTGRIDHLSIKDPLEFYGTGKSITDRQRPDRILRKQALYFVDNAITTKRPTGRRKR